MQMRAQAEKVQQELAGERQNVARLEASCVQLRRQNDALRYEVEDLKGVVTSLRIEKVSRLCAAAKDLKQQTELEMALLRKSNAESATLGIFRLFNSCNTVSSISQAAIKKTNSPRRRKG